MINDVVSGSLADRAGLRPNDRLIEVNGENVEAKSHSETVGKILDLSKDPHAQIALLVVERTPGAIASTSTSTSFTSPAQPAQPGPSSHASQSPQQFKPIVVRFGAFLCFFLDYGFLILLFFQFFLYSQFLSMKINVNKDKKKHNKDIFSIVIYNILNYCQTDKIESKN